MRTLIDRRTKVAGWAAVCAFIVATPHGASAQNSDAVAEGARVYGATCGRCHNPRSPLERTDRDWVTIVNHMRVRANLTGQQVKAVLAFLQAINTDPREPSPLPSQVTAAPTTIDEGEAVVSAPVSTDPQVLARGETLVAQRACLGCHVIGKAGGQVGPSLNGVVKRRGADFVRRKLADPTFDNATSMMPNFGLTSEDIEALLAFLSSLDDR